MVKSNAATVRAFAAETAELTLKFVSPP
jgi:hypothetical protein